MGIGEGSEVVVESADVTPAEDETFLIPQQSGESSSVRGDVARQQQRFVVHPAEQQGRAGLQVLWDGTIDIEPERHCNHPTGQGAQPGADAAPTEVTVAFWQSES